MPIILEIFLVDEDNNLSGILDWNSVSVVPAFIAAGYPWMRLSDEGFSHPDHHREAVQACIAKDAPLRHAFLHAAQREYPEFAEHFKAGQGIRSVLSFEYARRHCHRNHWMRTATCWANNVAPILLNTAVEPQTR